MLLARELVAEFHHVSLRPPQAPNGSLRAVLANDGADSHRPVQGFGGTSDGNESIVLRIGCSGWSHAHWRGVLDTAEVNARAGRLAAFGGDVYAYFDDDWEAFAVKNAEQLRDALGVDLEGAGSQRALGAVRRRARRTPSLR